MDNRLGDERLRREVESLLAEDDGLRSFLETPALAVAQKMSEEYPSQSIIGRRIGSYAVLSLLAKGFANASARRAGPKSRLGDPVVRIETCA